MASPLQRLARMHRSFAKNRSVLIEDYDHFTKLHAPIPQNKAERRSAEQSERQSPKQNGRQSSDKTDD